MQEAYHLPRSKWDGVHPIWTWDGVPPPHLDLGWGTSLSRPGMGYPPSRPGMGYPRQPDGAPPVEVWTDKQTKTVPSPILQMRAVVKSMWLSKTARTLLLYDRLKSIVEATTCYSPEVRISAGEVEKSITALTRQVND